MTSRRLILGALLAFPVLAVAAILALRGDGVGYYTSDSSPDGSEIVFESTRDGKAALRPRLLEKESAAL